MLTGHTTVITTSYDDSSNPMPPINHIVTSTRLPIIKSSRSVNRDKSQVGSNAEGSDEKHKRELASVMGATSNWESCLAM